MTSLSGAEKHQRQLCEVEARKSSVIQIQKYEALCRKKGIRCCVFAEKKVETVGKTICEIAANYEAACVVIGPRGLGTIERTIYGSVSDYLMRHLHVPVTFVPPPKHPVI